MPKVSVIVPNYNHAGFLQQRLDSIQHQTFKDYELILLDDKSSDDSLQILESYSKTHHNCKIYANPVNSGSPFAQWNKGVELAQGEYIWIAESDDYCEPELLEKLVEVMDRHDNVGIAYAQSTLVDQDSAFISSYSKNLEFIYPDDNWHKDFVKKGDDACRDWLLFHNPIPNASGVLFRKTAYLKAGKADPDMRLNGDWFLYTKILKDSDLAFLAEHLNYFRVHQDTQRERTRATFKVYEEILKINHFIRSHIPGSASQADKALTKIATWWTGSLPFQKWKSDSWRGNLKLYHIFKKYRSRLWFRILYVIVFVNFRRLLIWLGVLEKAKNVRRKLFPGKYFDQ